MLDAAVEPWWKSTRRILTEYQLVEHDGLPS
jgi:hypothetical protein